MLDVGAEAPDFTVSDDHGHTVRLSDFRGRKVILWFYPEADTPGCTAEGCRFRDMAPEFDRRHVAILGISFDAPAKNRAFAEKFHFPFPLLCDVDRKIGLAYDGIDADGEWPRRVSYLIDEKGRVAHVWPKVKASTHPDDVLAVLGA